MAHAPTITKVKVYTDSLYTTYKPFYLKLEWLEGLEEQVRGTLFNLHAVNCEDGSGWAGSFSNDSAQKQINELCQSRDDYLAISKKCLTGEGGEEFKLRLEVIGDTIKIRWNKYVDDMSQILGCLTLKKDNINKETLVDLLIKLNKELISTITVNNQQHEKMKQELEKCKIELEAFVTLKTSIESSLYGKFIEILNTKKQRIRSLEEQLQKYSI